MTTCPHCNGSGVLPDDPIAMRVAEYRAHAQRQGFSVLPGDRVFEDAAAALIGRAPKTLSNLAHGAAPIPFTRSGARRCYALRDLAEFELSPARAA